MENKKTNSKEILSVLESKGLGETKLEQLKDQPIVETTFRLSEDKKWVITRFCITDIRPVSYMEKVVQSSMQA